MFNENLKILRKSKGFTQEELAIKVNVVRQTVSKWEKGLSVPDAEVLQKIADVLDVGVDELLGAEIKQENSKNEIAEQLARINEQMAVKNRRWGIFWKVVGIVLLISIIWNVLGAILFSTVTSSGTVQECVEETVIE
ncbi:MAG: helix-turn-helix transcriptional regulator [Lachnospiraceae bacterium]|nr:helix-turn-helix transcriptional regulator [Lachnospiraceae bacterium]